MDSIAAAFCPGVSCSSPIGLDAETALQCCLRAGMCKSVRLMDMSEFNPAVEDYNTGLDETDDNMCSIGFNIFPNGSSTQKWGIYMGIVYLSCPQLTKSKQASYWQRCSTTLSWASPCDRDAATCWCNPPPHLALQKKRLQLCGKRAMGKSWMDTF